MQKFGRRGLKGHQMNWQRQDNRATAARRLVELTKQKAAVPREEQLVAGLQMVACPIATPEARRQPLR